MVDDLLFSEFFHGDDGIRAHLCAAGAADAQLHLLHRCGMIAFAVYNAFVHHNDVLGTHSGAQFAPFAAVGVESDSCRHNGVILLPVVIPTVFSF
jgi:hypothetical protein